MSPAQSHDAVTVIARRWRGKRGSLIMALHDLQERFGYVPRDAAMQLRTELGVSLARVYEVITFYNYFRLESPGEHVVSVCMGTACYLKGAASLAEHASRRLGIQPGQTTTDGRYHLQTVRCVGCCGLAPVVTVDGAVIANTTRDALDDRLAKCEQPAQGVA